MACGNASRQIVDIRVSDNAGAVAKNVTKPEAYLKLDGHGARWCDADRFETLYYALNRRRRLVYRLREVKKIDPR